MFAWLERLWIDSLTSAAWVTVMPDWVMTASSPAPGTAPVLQLAAVSQSPPAGLIQFAVAGTERSSRDSTIRLRACGRVRSAGADDEPSQERSSRASNIGESFGREAACGFVTPARRPAPGQYGPAVAGPTIRGG